MTLVLSTTKRLAPPAKSTRTINSKHWQNARDLDMALKAEGIDPFEIMARFASGDVVALGYMTREEFEKPAQEIATPHGTQYRASGRDHALNLIPPNMRFNAAKELASYLKPKLQAIAYTDKYGTPINNPVVIYVPDNGRGPAGFAQAQNKVPA